MEKVPMTSGGFNSLQEELRRLKTVERPAIIKALEVAREVAAKPPVAMMLNKRRFAEATQAGFEDAMEAGSRLQAQAFASGEPQQYMAKFFEERAKKGA